MAPLHRPARLLLALLVLAAAVTAQDKGKNAAADEKAADPAPAPSKEEAEEAAAPAPAPAKGGDKTNVAALGDEAVTGLVVPDLWLTCGKNTPCNDTAACCAIWGVCGYTDRFCGEFCLSGKCLNGATPPPGGTPSPSAPSPPPEAPTPPVEPEGPKPDFIDDSVLVREGDVALAACAEPGWLIESVDSPLYGNAQQECNSTSTFKIVSAACVRQAACMLPAVNAVFDDPCVGVRKSLGFGYRCMPADKLPQLPPEPVPAPPPPPLTNPFDVPGEESIPACEQPKLGGRAKLKKGEEGKVEGASASDPCAAARKKDAAPAPGPSGSAEEGASNPFDGADVPPA